MIMKKHIVMLRLLDQLFSFVGYLIRKIFLIRILIYKILYSHDFLDFFCFIFIFLLNLKKFKIKNALVFYLHEYFYSYIRTIMVLFYYKYFN